MRCPECGRRVHEIHEVIEWAVRDLPCFEFQTAVIIELYRIRCPDCGVKAEKVEPLPSKAPYSKLTEWTPALIAEQLGLAVAHTPCAVPAGGEHGTRDRSAVLGAL